MTRHEHIVTALDIGTFSTKAVVAEVGAKEVNVLGVGQARTRGAREGKVVNVPQVTEAVERAIGDAEMMSGIEITELHVCLAGGFVRAVNRTGMAPVRRHVVGEREIDEVRRTATALPLAADEEVQAVVPQAFTVDETQGVADPRGMAATCLYGRYHVLTVSEQAVRNARRCCEQLDLSVMEVHSEALVSARGILDDDERELGVIVLDVGAGTTSAAVYVDGVLEYTGVVTAGGSHLVNDLAHGLRTPAGDAERLLEAHGCVDERFVEAGETFEIPGLGGREPRRLPREAMVEFLQPRAEEIVAAVLRDLERAHVPLDELAGGVVLTGGVAQLDGFPELAGELLGMPSRRGTPIGVGGLSKVVQRPAFAASVGLVQTAARGEKGQGERPRKSVVSRWQRRLRDMADDYL